MKQYFLDYNLFGYILHIRRHFQLRFLLQFRRSSQLQTFYVNNIALYFKNWTALKPDFNSLNFLERVLQENFQLLCANESDLENFIEFTPTYKKTVEWKCSFNFMKKTAAQFRQDKIYGGQNCRDFLIFGAFCPPKILSFKV